MKNLMFAALISILSFNTFADCTKAYEVKAEKRARSNSSLSSAAAWVGIVGVVATPLGLVTGSFVVGAASGVVLTTKGALLQRADNHPEGFFRLFKPTKNNTYYKVLRSIEDAKMGHLNSDLVIQLDRKVALNSFSDEELKAIGAKIIQYITEENMNQNLCKNENNKFKLLNFNRFVDKVAEQI